MKVFLLVWFGELISLFGSGLTVFALGIWVYQANNSVTQYALAAVFFTLPHFLFSPLAGIVADRWNRRLIMIFSDFAASLGTLMIILLFLTNHLAIWHIYLLNIYKGTCEAFQIPAYVAVSSQLVSKEQLNRVSGLRQLALATTTTLSPMLAGILWEKIQLKGILAIDFITFFFAVSILLYVRFPQMPRTTSENSSTSFSQDFKEGITYITSKVGLLALIIFVIGSKFLTGIVTVLFTPLVLSNYSPSILGLVMSLGSIGVILGSLMFTIYQGKSRYVEIILISTLLSGLSIFIVGLKSSIILYAMVVFLFMLAITLIDSANQVIINQKVDLNIQGRVISLQRTGMTGAWTFARLIGGFLADRVFEPMMKPGGLLANTIGKITANGNGRGISLMFLIMGILTIFGTMVAWQIPRLRYLEDELPDWTDKKRS